MMNKIAEYPELKENHKDHHDQPLAPHSTIQNSNFISETVVQMFLELQQAQCYDQCILFYFLFFKLLLWLGTPTEYYAELHVTEIHRMV